MGMHTNERVAYVPTIGWYPEETGRVSPWQRDLDRSHLPGCGPESGVLIDSAGIVPDDGEWSLLVCELSDGRYVAACIMPVQEDGADKGELYGAFAYLHRRGEWIDVTNLVA